MLFLIGEDGHGSFDIFIDYAKAIGDRIDSSSIYSRTLPSEIKCSHIACMNGHLFKEARSMFPHATFMFINTEQMVLSAHRKRVIKFHTKNSNVIHIDYSQQNLDILSKHIPSLRSVWIPQLPPIHPPPITRRPISIVFLGALSSERTVFLGKLGKQLDMCVYTYSGEPTPNTILVHNRLFGCDRDNVLRQTRIVLNIPIDTEHTIFPSLRIHWALYQGAHVVTFPCLQEPEWESPSLRRGIHVVDDFAANIKEVLEMPPPTLEEQDHAFFNERIQALLKLF